MFRPIFSFGVREGTFNVDRTFHVSEIADNTRIGRLHGKIAEIV